MYVVYLFMYGAAVGRADGLPQLGMWLTLRLKSRKEGLTVKCPIKVVTFARMCVTASVVFMPRLAVLW